MPKNPVPASIRTGQTLVCAQTGKKFVADPSLPNFVLHPHHGVLSFEGLLAHSLHDLADYTGPLACYLALNGKTVTNRLGAKLGDVELEKQGTTRGLTAVRVHDVHGQWWRGTGSGRGRILNLRPMADPTVPTYREIARTLIHELETLAAAGKRLELVAKREALFTHLHLET